MILKSLAKHFKPLITLQRSFLYSKNALKVSSLLPLKLNLATCSTKCLAELEDVSEEHIEKPKNSAEVLRKWGCNDNDLLKLFLRRPSLRNAQVNQLQSKLSLLHGLGITSSDLVKIVNCRPRFLSCRLNNKLDERLEYLMTLFGSKEVLVKAIIRNPSLLTFDYEKINSNLLWYEELGLCQNDLITMLISRPTMISRTSFCDEKLEYIQKAGVTKDSKMYKHLVAIIGVSRVETIREKVANLEKFGFLDDVIWKFFGSSPLLLTLSVNKVQRNMTFVVGTMKLPPHVVLKHPNFLFNNLELVMKPRFLLERKIQDMDLSPKIEGPLLFRALRMKEKRFLSKFVLCHPEPIAAELMAFYNNVRGIKRLAEASKKNVQKGFPF